MAEPPLRVLLYGRHVADVLDAGFGDTAVRYTDAARSDPARSRLSLSMPVRPEPYGAAYHGTRWVRSLLPEGHALEHAVREFQVGENDRFALLSAIGRDVAGALTVVPDGEQADDPRQRYEPLSNDELAELLARAHELPLGLDHRMGVRLSLAGLQDKVLLFRTPRSRQFQRPLYGAPSNVIVKPEPPEGSRSLDLSGIATNEALCLRLADACGLEAARAQVRTVGGVTALFVDRYDRRVSQDGTVARIHQEDLLSAIGRDPHLKYEQGEARRLEATGGFAGAAPVRTEPGPGLDDLAEVVERHRGKAALPYLVDVVVFNTAIGNADAHARNLSLLLRADGTVTFAPLYDLVSTRAFPDVSRDAPQLVAGVDDIDEIGVSSVVAHTSQWGLPAELVRRRAEALLGRVRARVGEVSDQLVAQGGDPGMARRVTDLVVGRCQGMLDR